MSDTSTYFYATVKAPCPTPLNPEAHYAVCVGSDGFITIERNAHSLLHSERQRVTLTRDQLAAIVEAADEAHLQMRAVIAAGRKREG